MWEPYDYEAQRDAQAAMWESHFPKCEGCGEHVVEGEEFTDIDGVYHWECFELKFRKTMPDWREL